ncbi:MAG TPA: nitrate- and nitrite sensing domain-containing protein [Jiangellaceae bacterium]
MTRTARGRRSTDGGAKRARANQRPTEKPSTTESAPSVTPKERASSAWRAFLHDRSVRSRVAALVLLPLLCTLVLGALFFKNALDDASTASKVEDLATVGISAADVLHAVQDERDITGLADGGATGAGAVGDARKATDDAIAALSDKVDDLRDADLGPVASDAVAAYDREIGRLPGYRTQRDTKTPPFDVSGAATYHRLADAVRGLVVAAGYVVDDPATGRLINNLDDISQAVESASMERGLFGFYLNPGVAPTAVQQNQAAVFQGEQDLLLGRFLDGVGDADQRRVYSNRVIIGNRAIASTRSDLNIGIAARDTKADWFENATTRLDGLREIEQETSEKVVDAASAATDGARWRAIVSALAVLAVLAVTILLALFVARSIVGPLRRLRVAALDTAKNDLPALVDRIHRDGPAAASDAKDAVQAEGKDEIGQVATAFNEVHSTAVKVAGQQALLRQNLDTIVVNLSRRTQSLVDRQLGEIEGLEARERDPDQLSTLFRIDHLATRVRRHAESLLVLAGVDEMRKQGTASPVLDVVRTAVGEVEQYPRVRFGVMPTDLVASAAVDDIAHLLAELIDNATEFSAPSTPVQVTSQPLLGGGLRIQVTDSGLGVPADQLAALNERLGNPGDIDVAASRTLGLYVVARLAAKHGIRIRLEAGISGGTVAQVDLPAHLILSPLDTTEGVIPAVTPETEAPSKPFAPDEPLSPYLPSGPGTDGSGSGPATSPGLPRRVAATTPDAPSPEVAPPSELSPWSVRADEAVPPARTEPLRPSGPERPAPSEPVRPAAATPSLPPAPGDNGGRPTVPWERPEHNAPAPTPPAPSVPTRPAPEPAEARSFSARHAEPRQPEPRQPEPRQPETRHESRSETRPAPSLRAPEPELPESDSPIYESVRSAWFSKGGDDTSDWSSPADEGWRRAAEALRTAEEAASARRVEREAQATVDTKPVPRAEPSWARSAAPSAPQAQPQAQPQHASAPAVEEPAALSTSGLPMRRRGASLLPGSIGEAGGNDARRPAAEAPPKDAGNVASTLSSLQRGVSRGREETGGWVPKRPSDPERSNP